MNNWKETTLGEVVEIIDGDRGGNYPKNHEFLRDGHCLFLNTKNVPNDSFSFDEKMFITEDKDSILRKGKLKRGDFVLTTRGTVGNFAFYSEKVPLENIRINSGMVILRARDAIVDRGFLNFYLKSHFFNNQVLSLSSGTAQPQLPIKDLSIFEIILPPFPEQKAIAAILSGFDDKIELLRRQNKTLESIAQTIFKEWFVNFTVNGKKLKVNSSTGLPEGWRVYKLREVFQFIKGRKPENVSGIQLKNYVPQILIDVLDGGKSVYANPDNMILSNKKDLIMVMDGASSGRVEFGFSGIIGSTLSLLVFRIPCCSICYFYLKRMEKDICDNTTGSAIPHTDKDRIYHYDIALPLNNLEDFEEFFNAILIKISNNREQIQTLSKLRDTLLPKLMKGEIRVKT